MLYSLSEMLLIYDFMILWQKISLECYNGSSGFKIYEPVKNAIMERNHAESVLLKLFIVLTRYLKKDSSLVLKKMHFYLQRFLMQCIQWILPFSSKKLETTRKWLVLDSSICTDHFWIFFCNTTEGLLLKIIIFCIYFYYYSITAEAVQHWMCKHVSCV